MITSPWRRTWPRTLLLAALVLTACERAAPNDRTTTSTPAQPPASATTVAGLTAAPPAERATWPTPSGWEQEVIPFPFTFAPSLAYRGVEELRFAPGFYEPASPGYWSYDIVWWLTEKPQFDAATMETAMTTYFRGLATSVGRGKFRVDSSLFHATLAADGAPTQLRGEIHTVDAFTTGKPITLYADMQLRTCAKAGRHAVVFQLSPRPRTDPMWQQLSATSAALRCE